MRTDSATPIYRNVIQKECPLQQAQKWCKKHSMPLWGRLCLNRHYTPGSSFTSEFADNHPEYYQIKHNGKTDTTRLSFAFAEVRQERINILLEAQRLGVDALVLDFCRQQPHGGYHPAEVEPFTKKFGQDPRQIKSHIPRDFASWFKYRSNWISIFMRELRQAVKQQEEELKRPCPIIVRVPDSSEWVMIAGGMDIELWYAEDLIDATMLSPFQWCLNDLSRHPEYHVALAHKYGKQCIGGIGSLNLIEHYPPVPHKQHSSFDATPIYDSAIRQLNAGVDGMSVYQTDCVCRMPWLKNVLPFVGNPDKCKEKRKDIEQSRFGMFFTGLDWHSGNKHGLHGTCSGEIEPL